MPRYIDADELYRATQKRISEAHEARMAIVDDEFLDLIDDAFTEDVAPRADWISVEERLPENDWGKHWKERKYYLVFTKPSGLMNVAVYGYKEHDWWIDRNSCVLDKKNYKEVTHWMPMPEPPNMKGDAE